MYVYDYISSLDSLTPKSFYEAYYDTPLIKTNLDFLARAISSNKIEFSDSTNVNDYLMRFTIPYTTIAHELILYGFSICNIDYSNYNITTLPPRYVLSFKTKNNTIESFIWVDGKEYKFTDELIILTKELNPLMGSLLYPLLKPLTFTYNGSTYQYSLLNQYKALLFATSNSAIKSSSKKNLILATKAIDPKTLEKIFTKSLTNEFIVASDDMKVQELKYDNESSLEILNKYEDLINVATLSNISKLLNNKGYTYASMKVAHDIINEGVNDMKLEFMAQIEKLARVLLRKRNISVLNLKIRQVDQKVFTFDEIITLLEKGVISKDEARKYLSLD
ncbi:MAG: hypothetical protein QW156_04835 [Candidatus Aenigmatarchaeota archaeon]